jgi:hypothetical protein
LGDTVEPTLIGPNSVGSGAPLQRSLRIVVQLSFSALPSS